MSAPAPHKVKAEQVMLQLLRTPKTRSGLYAASRAHGLSRHWIRGWVSNAEMTGVICTARGGRNPQYVLATEAGNKPSPLLAILPDWMCPKPPPPYGERRIYRLTDASAVPQEQKIKDAKCRPSNPTTRTALPAS